MTVIDRILGRPQTLPSNSVSPIENPAVPLTDTSLIDYLHVGGHHLTGSGIHVDERKALTMAAVWRSVNLIAGGASSLPLHPFRQQVDDGGRITPRLVTSGNAATLLENPHPDLTKFEFWELKYSHMLLWGNAYSHKLRTRAGVLSELWPIHPSRVVPFRDKTSNMKRYVLDGSDELGDAEILHVPGFGYDGIKGLSPIGMARAGIGVSLAAEDFGGKLFGNGSMAGGILQTDKRLKQEDADALKARWEARAAGLHNAHRIAVLDSGAKFEQLTIPPEDAQYIQTRAFQIEEIARIFGVPPHLLMANEKTTSWGTGVEQQTLGFVTFTLRPWLTRVEQRLTRVLKPEPVYAKYSVEGLLRGDSAARAAFYTSMWQMGVFSVNEIRALEELPPVEGGDERFRSTNSTPLTGVPAGLEGIAA